MNKQKMPKDFFWGNSVSSMQTEGAWNEDGKGLSVYDVRPATENTTDWHTAIDEYHRYDEDLDLMKEMNMNMYRIQISWSRVCPEGDGEFNPKGIDFYDRLINAMLKRGIDRVKYWIVFNEHNLYFQDEVFNISGYEKGNKSLDDMYTIFHHTMISHIRLANYIHEKYDDVKIGGMLAYQQIYPETSKATDVWAAKQAQEFLNFNIYDADTGRGYSPEVMQYAKDHDINWDITDEDKEEMEKAQADFLAFSYYSSWTLSADKIPKDAAPNRYMNYGGVENKYLKTNDWGWTIDPLGFRNAITTMYNHYKIPGTNSTLPIERNCADLAAIKIKIIKPIVIPEPVKLMKLL